MSATCGCSSATAVCKLQLAVVTQECVCKLLGAMADDGETLPEDFEGKTMQEEIDRQCADNIRMLVVDAVNRAGAGHPGLPMGLAEVGYVLWKDVMKFNPKNPLWFNRDRFVLSAGHGCLLQYICLHLVGYDLQLHDLRHLCKLGAPTPGHPENVTTPGIEVTTGPLGQGVANAVGFAIAEKHLAARFNKPDAIVVDHRTYCIMGDGCAMEGISNEAASLAGHLKLHKLTLIYDDNHSTIDGHTDLAFSEDVAARFRALGWHTITIHDVYQHLSRLQEALLQEAVEEEEKPTLIQVKSSIGRLSRKEGTAKAHHGTFDDDDVKQMKEKCGWPSDGEPFHIMPMVYERFKANAERGGGLEQRWNEAVERYEAGYPKEGQEFRQLVAGRLPWNWADVLPKWSEEEAPDATRNYSDKCLNAVAKVIPGLLGGSADLVGSSKAFLRGFEDFSADSPWGRNIHYGVREHAMAGISNGLALHTSGLIPFAATFLIFSDYMKNAMRLSALSQAQVLYILTHDSIGLGEDGPTHQPVEQLVGLRAIPNMVVLRPADGKETAGAYKVAIERQHGPTVISLSRQQVQANVAGTSMSGVEKGGYIVSDNSGKHECCDIILISTGSELCLCQGAADRLRNKQDDVKVRVVSLVSWEIFDRQPQEYRESILPPTVHRRIAVEAGSPIGWAKYVGATGHVMGMSTYGESGAYLDVFKKYGFTIDCVEQTARQLLQQATFEVV